MIHKGDLSEQVAKIFDEAEELQVIFYRIESGKIARKCEGGCFVDAGANIGNHTIFYAREMKASRVFSFEPVPETFEILSRNIRLNHLEQTVSAFACGVSDVPGKADFTEIDITNIGATRLYENTDGDIPMTTLDQAVGEQRVDFLKIDVEGMEIEDDADLDRFAKLGVIANFTPHWHAGDPMEASVWLGKERASKQFRCKTVWDTGALVAWSSDNITFEDFTTWNPYLGMEVGMTRRITEKTRDYEYTRCEKVFPPEDERMSIEEMLLGYTINGAKQLGIEASKGSIEAGKDADFLVFDKDLLTAEHEGFSYNKPRDVYFCGKKVN